MDEALFWSLPGPGHWLNKFLREVRQSRLVVVELPVCGVPVDVVDQLESILRSKYSRSVRVDLPSVGTADDVTGYISDVVFESPTAIELQSESIDEFFRGMGSIVVDAKGVGREIVMKAVRVFESLVSRTKEMFDEVPVALVADGMMLNEVRSETVATVWWDKFLSELDVQVYIDGACRYFNVNDSVMKAMLTFAKYEFELIHFLLSNKWDGLPSHAYELQKKFLMRNPERIRIDDAERAVFEVGDSVDWWRDGLLLNTRDGRRLVSPFVDPKQISIGIWKAQVRELFPILEDRRLWILEAMKSEVFVWTKTQEWIDEFGDPEIRDLHDLSRRYFPQAEVVLDWMRKARNKLAHGEALSPSFIAKGERLMNEFTREFPHISGDVS